MLVLGPGSVCDVCAEEYGPLCLPHCIPCGHVLCATCCNAIVDKTSSRFSPVCPFCREQFTSDTIRLIRVDFSSSGWVTPRRRGGTLEANDMSMSSSGELSMDPGGSRVRAEARRLEDKVAKVAAKKCSVEEVKTLHKELQEWLHSEMIPDEETSSLALSAALLKAILINHFAHSESSKIAKIAEATLAAKLDDMEIKVSKLNAELDQQRAAYTQKAQECHSLRSEINRHNLLKSIPTGSPIRPNSAAPTASSEARRQSTLSSTSTSTSSYNPNSPLSLSSRFSGMSTSTHLRSSSGSIHSTSSRPTTPGGSLRPSTAASYRPSTPAASSFRPTSPVPPVPQMPRIYSSPSSPTKSGSEKERASHQRWLPGETTSSTPALPTNFSFPTSLASRAGHQRRSSVSKTDA